MDRKQVKIYKTFFKDRDFVKNRNENNLPEGIKTFVLDHRRLKYKIQDGMWLGAAVTICLIMIPPLMLYDKVIGLREEN